MAKRFTRPVDREEVSTLLLRLRRSGGYSLREVGAATDISFATIGQIERGKYMPGLDLFLRLLKFYDLDLFYQSRREFPSLTVTNGSVSNAD